MSRRPQVAPLALLAALAAAPHAAAFPGAFVTKSTPAIATTTHVIVAKKADTTVVTVMADYDGPLEAFVVLLPVPGDVTLDRAKTLKREYVTRVDKLTAPRFHEFWETDPCDQGPVQQEWERDLSVTGAGFLGGGDSSQGGGAKVAKELLLKMTADYKEGEFTYSLLSSDEAQHLGDALKPKGYVPSPELAAKMATYGAQGMKVLVAEVDPNKIELVGGSLAQLSPIRFWTDKPFDTLPVTLGLQSFGKAQELFIHVIDPAKRYEAKNYGNAFAPTNIEVDFSVKERMAEFYASLQDIFTSKKPGTFLTEYAWSTDGCGQPCQDEKLLIHELLALGGEIFETKVPDAEAHPKPPDMTDEEQKALKARLEELKPADRKKAEKVAKEDRIEVARRKGVVERNQYVLTRLHYRYTSAAELAKDVQIGPVDGHVRGGVALPKGKEHATEAGEKPSDKAQFQTRYNNYHAWKGMQECPTPERWRWGKAPRDYRGLRKVWVVEDIARKSRTQIKAAEVVLTAIPELGLAAAPPKPEEGAPVASAAPSASAGAAAEKKGCSVAAGHTAGGPSVGWLVALGALLVRRRGR